MQFENTEIAFISKSNRELRRAYWLFRAVGSPFLVKTGSSLVRFLLKTGLPVSWILKPTIYRQFCGGESLEACQPVVEQMARHGVRSILDYSVEGNESAEGIREALEETLRAIRFAGGKADLPFAVFKPTAFTLRRVLEKASAGELLDAEEQQEADRFRERILLLCQTASELQIPILIDAEDTFYQALIDQVVEEMMQRFNRERALVFNTFQMYRTDRLDFLKESYRKAVEGGYFLGAKFVRGAYMEKERERAQEKGIPSPIQPDKESTDRDYNAALEFSVEHIDRISIFNGTHNEYSSSLLTRLMEQHGLPRNDERIWFSQLYGMSDHISFNLAHQGYHVAKYLPYGPVRHVVPYLLRRAEENTSVAGQSGRELSLITREVQRRKAIKS